MGCIGVFVASRGFLWLPQAGTTLCCGVWASHCGGFFCWQSLSSRRAGFSRCGSRAVERRLSIGGARAQLLHGMWDLPGPGLKPVSPALAGGFLTTEPPGKPMSRYDLEQKEEGCDSGRGPFLGRTMVCVFWGRELLTAGLLAL